MRSLIMCAVCDVCEFAYSAEYADAGNPCPLCKPGKRRKAAKPASVGETPAAMGWRCWREIYSASQRGYLVYVSEPADGSIMVRVANHAVATAAEMGHEGQGETLVRWWFKRYLREDGSKTFILKDHRHALRFFERCIPTFGPPPSWVKAEPLAGRPVARLEDLPQHVAAQQDPDASIAVPAAFRDALKGFGSGGNGATRRRPT